MSRKRKNPREILTTLIELAAAAIVAFGVAMIYVPAGVIVAGGCLFGISYLIQRKGATRE